MTGSGIWIELADLPSYSPAFRSELQDRWFRPLPGKQPAASGGGDPDVPELDLRQAEAVLNGTGSDSVLDVLREVVRRKGEFTYGELIGQLGLSSEELRGAWGGVTKLVRFATGNKRARLMKWKKRDGIWYASVPAASVEALKAAFVNF